MTDTPQTDAPERIWAFTTDYGVDEWTDHDPALSDEYDCTEYIRADALDARDAVIAELVEALSNAQKRLDASLFTNAEHSQAKDIIRAALSKARKHREGKL